MKEDKKAREDIKMGMESSRVEKQFEQAVPQPPVAPQMPVIQHMPAAPQMEVMEQMPVTQQVDVIQQMPVTQQMPVMMPQMPMICCPLLMNTQCPMLGYAGMGVEHPMPHMGFQSMMNPCMQGTYMPDTYMSNPYFFSPGYMYNPEMMFNQGHCR